MLSLPARDRALLTLSACQPVSLSAFQQMLGHPPTVAQ